MAQLFVREKCASTPVQVCHRTGHVQNNSYAVQVSVPSVHCISVSETRIGKLQKWRGDILRLKKNCAWPLLKRRR